MKKATYQQWSWLVLALLLTVSVAPAQNTNFFQGLAIKAVPYKQSVDEAIAQAKTDTPKEVSDFLVLSGQFADTMIQLPGRDEPYSAKVDILDREKSAWDAQLSVLRKRALTKDPACKIERKGFRKHIQPVLNDRFIGKNRAKGKLFELKYFEKDDKRAANFIEGFINSKVPLLRYKEVDRWHRQHGVSAWEATTRFEPIALMNSDNDLGGLVALGLVYNFFPTIDAQKNPPNIYMNDSWRSKYLKRVGLRFGAGATFDEGDALIGSGIQERRIFDFGPSVKLGLAHGSSTWKDRSHETAKTKTHGGVQGQGRTGGFEGHGYGEPDRGEVRGASRSGGQLEEGSA